MSFSFHLLEAIYINFLRSFYYAKKSYGLTVPLSLLLIFLELSILPFALLFDIWALKYNIKGIVIVKDDFVSMQNIEDKSLPSIYRHSSLSFQSKECLRINSSNSFEKIYSDLSSSIECIKRVEKDEKAHFSMTLHILESVAFFTKHAIKYQKQNPKTVTLSKVMIKFQLLGLYTSRYFDYFAQQYHKKELGIVVNDLPKINF